MDTISAEIKQELRRRLEEGPYNSLDELLRVALKALDDCRDGAEQWLEQELLKGLEGEEVEFTKDEFRRLREPFERRIAKYT